MRKKEETESVMWVVEVERSDDAVMEAVVDAAGTRTEGGDEDGGDAAVVGWLGKRTRRRGTRVLLLLEDKETKLK